MKKSEELVRLACEAMKNSYSPYSGFRVGAALRCEDGSVFVGCNIENSAFSPTCCAERTAFFKAVSEGKNKFSEICKKIFRLFYAILIFLSVNISFLVRTPRGQSRTPVPTK